MKKKFVEIMGHGTTVNSNINNVTLCPKCKYMLHYTIENDEVYYICLNCDYQYLVNN